VIDEKSHIEAELMKQFFVTWSWNYEKVFIN